MINGDTKHKPKFHDTFVTICRAHHLREQTIRAYWHQARHFIKWSGAKSAHALEADATERMREYLSAMANDSCSASTQNQSFHALRFMFEHVLDVRLGDLSKIPRATREERIVDVPPDDVAKRLVEAVPGTNGLALRLIYGTAMRLNDCLRLRVKDLDFRKKMVMVQESKGGKSRIVPMPETLAKDLAALVRERGRIHNADIVAGFGCVHMPGKLAEKYPAEPTSLGWQYVFAADHIAKDPLTGNMGRHHIMDATLQRAFSDARKRLRITRHYTIHGLRHACAQFWERNGVQLSETQKLLGHKDVQTTLRYLKSGLRGVPKVPSPI